MNDAEWQIIAEFPDYEVSSTGLVRRRTRARGAQVGAIIKWHTNVSTAYPTVRFMRDGRQHARNVHSLVARAFHGPRPDGLQVRHLDGDTMNCRATNLCYGTAQENANDKVRHGRTSAGERNPRAKLTIAQVAGVREARSAGESAKAIARRLGLNPSTVHRIVSGVYWSQEASNRAQDRGLR